MLASAATASSVTPFVPAGGALLFLLAAGILLWALGGRLLRPGLAIIGLLAGIPVGIWLGGAVAPEVPPLFFAAGGALAGLVIASISYVLALAAVTGVLTGIISLMAAWTAADMGWIDAAKAADRIDGATGAMQQSAPSLASFDTLTRILLGAQGGSGADGGAPGASPSSKKPAPSEHAAAHQAPGPGDAAASPGILARAREAIESHWSTMPQPLRTLLIASLAAGVVVGFLFGLLCAQAAARVVTSLAGSIILLVAGVPLLTAALGRSDDLLPSRPGAWFVAIALLTIIGYGVQRAIAPPPRPQPQQA